MTTFPVAPPAEIFVFYSINCRVQEACVTGGVTRFPAQRKSVNSHVFVTIVDIQRIPWRMALRYHRRTEDDDAGDLDNNSVARNFNNIFIGFWYTMIAADANRRLPIAYITPLVLEFGTKNTLFINGVFLERKKLICLYNCVCVCVATMANAERLLFNCIYFYTITTSIVTNNLITF